MHFIEINIPTQQLHYFKNNTLIKTYLISSAAKGVGEQNGSFQTPRGLHIVRAKIGANQPLKTIFIERRPQGICTAEMEQAYPDRDWILTRILWLSGKEIGKNRLGSCDTMRRYIYIHGCANSRPLGVPGSKGCIRMGNEDIVELFDAIPFGTKVEIRG